jgi:hypothetical protein
MNRIQGKRNKHTAISSIVAFMLALAGCFPSNQNLPTDCSEKLKKDRILSQELSSLRPVLLEGKWGFIDKTGKLVVKPRFDFISESFEYQIVSSLKDEKWRLIDESRLAVGTINGKWGFIDRAGNIVVPLIFQQVGRFIGGRASVKLDNKWGFVDINGKIIPPQFDQVTPFVEERAFVRIKGLWGVINTRGDFLVKPQFSSQSVFSQGLAAVSFNRDGTYKTALIDRDGNIVFEPQNFDLVIEGRGFQDGLIIIESQKFSPLEDLFDPENSHKRRARGFMNHDREIIVAPKYDSALGFKNCFAQVKVSGKWGFVNTKGEVTIQPKFEELPSSFAFPEKLAMVKMGQNYGYIDLAGRSVVKPRFHQARPFSEGLAAVQISRNGKWGFINTRGEIVIEPQFDVGHHFINGIARVSIRGKTAYINRDGLYIWKPTK